MANSRNSMVKDAIAIFGLDIKQLVVVKSQIVGRQRHLPYLSNEESILKIRINTNRPLAVKVGNRTGQNLFVRSWDLFHSKNTNQLIKAVSVWPKGVQGTPFPSIEVQERQMEKIGHSFHEAPTLVPKIKLMDAIHSAWCAVAAKQIIAYHVIDSYTDLRTGSSTDRRQVWIIHAWGIPPFSPPVPKGFDPEWIHPDARNHLRTVINAQNGHVYGADTIPQPELV